MIKLAQDRGKYRTVLYTVINYGAYKFRKPLTGEFYKMLLTNLNSRLYRTKTRRRHDCIYVCLCLRSIVPRMRYSYHVLGSYAR